MKHVLCCPLFLTYVLNNVTRKLEEKIQPGIQIRQKIVLYVDVLMENLENKLEIN